MTLALIGGMAGAVVGPSEALAQDGEPHPAKVIPKCTESNRANEVCFDKFEIRRGDTPQPVAATVAEAEVAGNFVLVYQDESVVQGEGSAEFTLRAGVTGDDGSTGFLRSDGTTGFLENPQAGDRGEYVISYPAKNTTRDLDGHHLRGEDLGGSANTGAFAVATAADFTFSKVKSGDLLEFTVDITYAEVAGKNGCDFLQGDDGNFLFDEDTGFSFPTPQCEAANTLSADAESDSFVMVQNDVAFFATSNAESALFSQDFNGAFLNYQGVGVSYFIETFEAADGDQPAVEGAFQFQLLGPKFAVGTTLNTGAIQAFLPKAAVDVVFGEGFDLDNKFAASRVDSEPGVRTVQDLVAANAVTTTVGDDGSLLIEVANYGFSAPVFSFASTDRPPFTTLTSGSTPAASASAASQGIFLHVVGTEGRTVEGTTVLHGSTGVARNSPYTLTIQEMTAPSASRTLLASGVTNGGGHVEGRIQLGAVAPGSYRIVMTGTHRLGHPLVLTNHVVVDGAGTFTSVSPESLQPTLR